MLHGYPCEPGQNWALPNPSNVGRADSGEIISNNISVLNMGVSVANYVWSMVKSSLCRAPELSDEGWYFAGIAKALKERGIREGDMVVIGETELEWSDDQSEGALYDAWYTEQKAQGRVLQGSARWPHAG